MHWNNYYHLVDKIVRNILYIYIYIYICIYYDCDRDGDRPAGGPKGTETGHARDLVNDLVEEGQLGQHLYMAKLVRQAGCLPGSGRDAEAPEGASVQH